MRFRTPNSITQGFEQGTQSEQETYTYSPITTDALSKYISQDNEKNTKPTELILTGVEWNRLAKADFGTNGYMPPVEKVSLDMELKRMSELTKKEYLSPEKVEVVVRSVNFGGSGEFEVKKLIDTVDNSEFSTFYRSMRITKNDLYTALTKVAEMGEEKALPKID